MTKFNIGNSILDSSDIDTKQNPLLQKAKNVTEGKNTTQNNTSNFASVIVSNEPQNVNQYEHSQPKIVKLSIDYIGYKSKPNHGLGKITNRIKDTRNVKEITLKELSKQIITGHAFTNSYANTGVKDKDFISADIVCLDFDGNISIQEVLDILEKHNIIANIIYYTYSHGEKGERFRVITALTETVTDKNEYKCIIKGYMSLFNENVDNATVALVQRFLGTNKGLVRDVDETSTTNKQIFLDLYKKNYKHKKEENKRQETQKIYKENININDFDLQKEIDNYNLLDYIRKTYPTSEFKHASGGVFVNPCPFCGHNDHLHITGNKFHSFGNKSCLALGGVGIVQWLIYAENLPVGQAIAKFKYDILGIDEKQDKRAYAQAMAQKEQAKSINKQSANEDKQKKPYFKIENLENELSRLHYEVKFNQITNSKAIFKDGIRISKQEANEIPTTLYSDFCDKYKGININLIGLYLNTIAKKHKYNPVLDLFNANEWDKQDHLTEVYKVLGINPEDKLSRSIILKWFWQGHALLRNNEVNPFGADGVLTLTGNQGIGKTTVIRHFSIMGTPEFFREGQKLSSFDKDTERRCITTWIAELGEIDTTFKFADMGMLKAFITKSFDEYRLPYGREDEQSARRANFAATVNGDKFLIDPTGNRRFWTVPVKNVDLDGLKKINALQVWLQVWEQYAKHNLQGFRLTKEEQKQLSERNEQHEKGIVSEAEILDILDEARAKNYEFIYMTVSEFKGKYNSLRNYSVTQIGKVLDKLGIEQTKKKINGNSSRVRLLPNTFINSTDYNNL